VSSVSPSPMDFKRNSSWKLRLGCGLRRQRASHLALCCDRDESVVVLCLAAGCVLVPCPATILSHLRSTSGLEKTGGGTLWAVSLVNLLPLLTPSSRFDNDGTRYCQCHAYLRDNRPTPPLRMISPLPHCSLIQPVPLTGPRSKRECRGRPHLQGCDVCASLLSPSRPYVSLHSYGTPREVSDCSSIALCVKVRVFYIASLGA
jgi:hypothetical protein